MKSRHYIASTDSGTESDAGRPSGRPRKRLRTSRPAAGSCEDIGKYGAGSASSREDESEQYATGNSSPSASPSNAVSNESSPKPKSKYRIHIPKHSEYPVDDFFTQPPQRSSSPYRIDHFHWRKPPVSKSHVQIHKTSEETQVQASTNRAMSSKADATNTVRANVVNAHDSDSSGEEYGDGDDINDLLAAIPENGIVPRRRALEISTGQETTYVSSQVQGQDEQMDLPRRAAPLSNLRQITLFGTQAQDGPASSQTNRKRNWPLANREEIPTHHQIDANAMATWIYPTNLGKIREYQFSIVAKGLYHNLLVALPTGLGKTFIAATIMLNWFRWTVDAQIVFVAPTKPLVSQQVKACFGIAGIPKSATSMLTGTVSPGVRAEEWRDKRVFFMTPQTLINDLKTGIADPKRLILIVVDEAHRAKGGYAYVEVVKFVRRFNSSFRVLALTATPGSSIESVQEVIDGLGIARVEIRTEDSLDIREYVHARKIDTVFFNYSDEMTMIMDLFSHSVQPVLDKLMGLNAYWSRDPMTLTTYGCLQARQKWQQCDAGRNASYPIKSMVAAIFGLLGSLSHAVELLKFHGIGPFYHKVANFRQELHANGKAGGKYANMINEHPSFSNMMSRVGMWVNSDEFIGHPKLQYVQEVVMNHFLGSDDRNGHLESSNTRIMIFSHYRDSAEEIARILRRHTPLIRPHVFVGQSTAKGSEGMDQKTQLNIIQKFKSGTFNTLVATSIGEEGLDIGEVDLIVCYDASASPIRLLQRMGRTGRKRAGNIVVTLMRGKEENSFLKAKDNYEKMQQEIASGARFAFHEDSSRRIVPRDIQPTVVKEVVDIPEENTQAELPEPTRRGRPPKRPPKKFHLPDGVRTGFVSASRIDASSDESAIADDKSRNRRRSPNVAPIPRLDDVVLTAQEEGTLGERYLKVVGDTSEIIDAVKFDAFPALQRVPRPTKRVRHGEASRRFAHTWQSIHDSAGVPGEGYSLQLLSQDRNVIEEQSRQRKAFFEKATALPATRSTYSRTSQSEDTITSSQLAGSEALHAEDGSSQLASHSSDAEDLQSFLADSEVPSRSEVSSRSSSPLEGDLDRPFYQSQHGFSDKALESDELPEVGALVAQGSRQKQAQSSRQRRAKQIVCSDSDE